ncbi:2-amino-4-hydroxy-6-hydroxymethyldihydropteridine diphosphokinase [Periweissella cryptocerci]|uniref:2-amino-4-hydroxy-6-hydroxymethyldihydropteridine diphosphokinase n=1 Tax=Periweissella cryptocerci TaxID=2506420 RepID=A0A4P6YRL4_9LACO|nr:2-amino-4-hydroxy-6-hydroxymethyldihydropteridine diphosphokinase [Periweissella cryptocerci]QBO35242.1 2-amino-4-hydroxy-6-hydroxymethyldihydropteridine diphosphokinase [Periweissella cryptocerci]
MTQNKVSRAYLSIGANMGNPREQLEAAMNLLRQAAGIIEVRVSSFYASEPVGGVVQDDFLNQGVLVITTLTPVELLHTLQAIEQQLHRERLIHWGPRTIDLDIVDIPGFISDTAELKVPHPEMANRRFVLVPLLEVSADDTEFHAKVTKLLEQTTDQNWVKKEA